MQTLHAVHYLANQIFASDSLQKKPQGFKQTNIYEEKNKNSIRFTHFTRHSYLIPEQILTLSKTGIYNIETITRIKTYKKGQVKLWKCSIKTMSVCYLKSQERYSNGHFSTSNVGSLVVYFIVITSNP